MDLSDRKKKILRAIIENYIETAEPVGSKAVASTPGLNVSSATVRNEMADLEELGLLEQPHTSAGRIPSPKGYRIYVNELMDDYRLSVQETRRLNEALHLKMRELDQVIDQAGRVVSQLTRYPAFALADRASKVTIQRFDLLMVASDSFIIVVMTDTNVVRNRLVRLPADLSEAQLQLLNTLLNTTFTGLTLDEITPELMRVASHAAGEAYGLISLVVSFAIDVLESLEQRTVHTAGIASLLSHPEYQSLDRAAPLMSYLSEDQDAGRRPHGDSHRARKRGGRPERHQCGGGKLRDRRRHARGHRRGGPHPDGLRQDHRAPCVFRLRPHPPLRNGRAPSGGRRRQGKIGGNTLSKKDQKKDPIQESPAEHAQAQPSAEADCTPEAETAPDPLVEELEALKNELAEKESKYLRLAAEYDNFRKRSQKEKESAYADAKTDAVSAFLPVYDNLERALKQETCDEAYAKGVEMTMTGLKEIMTRLGIEEIPALGQPFDPSLHNAVMHVEDESAEENTVVEVFQAGFRLGEKVIRFAMVKVAN